MRAVIQRVKEASVSVDNELVSFITNGYLIYLGVEQDDNQEDFDYILKKTKRLRIFSDTTGKMNLNIADAQGEILVVSQFTLCGDVRKGNRPSFSTAASSDEGKNFYNLFCIELEKECYVVKQGIFQAHMQVYSINDGPVTILLDSRRKF